MMKRNFLSYLKKAAFGAVFLFSVISMSLISYAGPSSNVPDFAFPEKVEKDADIALKSALSQGNDVAALKAVVQLIAARNLVSASTVNANATLLDSVSGCLKAPYSQLADLLEATIYAQLYQVSPWQYNNRTLPLDSYPEDPLAWSGDLFAKKVLSLVDKATADMAAAKGVSITEIQPLLVNYEYAEKADMSVCDFIVAKSCSLLETFGSAQAQTVIPFYGKTEKVAANVREACGLKRSVLVDSLYEWRASENNMAAKVWAIKLKGETLPYNEQVQFFKEWIDRLPDTSESGLLIHSYYDLTYHDESFGADHKRKLYDMLTAYLDKFPKSDFSSAIKYDLAQLTRKTASLELPSVALSTQLIKGKLTANNINTAYVLLYSVPESIVPMNSLNVKEFPAKAKFIKAIKLDVDGSVPFTSDKEFELPKLAPGYYVALPSAKSTLSSNWKNEVERWSLNVVNVTDIAVVTSNNSRQKNSGKIYVVDAATQRPLPGAEVRVYPDNRVKNPIKTLVTDKEGSIDAPEGFLRIRVSDGKSVVWQSSDIYYNESRKEESKSARVLTDLSIYKPGDMVQFSVVAWSRMGHTNKLLGDTPLKIIFRDANWNAITTDTLTTDKFGRANGKFTIPKEGLLGRYSISVAEIGSKENEFGSQGFEVAEYKTPTFFVTVASDSEKTYEPGETVKFTGEVKTYSGMTLGDSQVNYTVEWHQWWRWWSSGVDYATYSGTATIGSDGKFEIELPTDKLKGTPFERGIFTLTATATSPAGETQTSSPLRFALGDGFSVRPEIRDENMKISGDSIRLNVPVYDILDHPVVKDVDYAVVNVETGKELLKGSFQSPVLKIPAVNMPSGKYKFQFNLPTDTITTDTELVLWRESDKTPPYATPLWLTETQIVVPQTAKSVEVKVGSGYADSWLLCQISDEERIIERKWVAVNGENINVKVDAPQSDSRRWVSFIGMHDHDSKMSTVMLVPEQATRKMEVKTVSFRDKISAGDKETWTFSFKVADDAQKGIPAMAVMSNKALDILAPFNWNFTLGGDAWYNAARLMSSHPYNRMVTAAFSVMPRYSMPNVSMPNWETYNQLLAGASHYGGVMVRGMRKMAMSRSDVDGVEYAEAEVSNEVFNAVEQGAPIPMANMMTLKEEKVMAAEAQDAVVEEAATTAGAADNGAGSVKKEEPRPVDMPLAFFMPSLWSDAEGNVNVEFVTPNFNTTWKFQIMGYNEELLSAGTVLEAVASKPVMVQVNPPRYLRTGDKATISALLFNNSPENQMLHGEIIVFNPLTGETITSKHLGAESTTPGANRVMTVDFTAPSDLTALGIRAYAYGGDFTDGEQTLIPILPASTPVVESTQFYLGNDEHSFTQKLPKFRKEASLTLKYCNNPVWECVLALPAISTPDSKNVLSLSRALYANGMAKGIMDKYPSVKSGLEKVFEAKEGAGKMTLTSNLQKDSLLKTVALINTPWVNNASSETMRMESLNELLDAKRLGNALTTIQEQLKNLQNSDGGWSWCEGMRSSEYMTSRVLEDIAALQTYGVALGTKSMTAKAIAYCDKELYDDYVKNKKQFSTLSMLRYLYVRSAFDKGDGKSGFATLKREALKAINSDWKDFSVYDKATAALLLNRAPGYEKTARVILESLRQLASKSETKGWWYDNLSGGWTGMPKLTTTARVLEAFAEIEPNSEAVDGLRQWLVLQKETEDWGGNSYTAGVISSILNSGTDWTDTSAMPVVKLDGKTIDIAGSQMLTGIITVQLDNKQASGKALSIEKSNAGPAWGGVISQYIAPMSEVKAESSENLKIEKQLLLLTEGADGRSTQNINLSGKTALKVGDKVRVTLTLTCDKDMDYVAVIDERSACLEPVDQISSYSVADGLGAYREVRDTKTSFFIGYLPKGVNVISYDCYVDRDGTYALGIASAQSQYSPLQAAHSAGGEVRVSASE
ncbi:MAG: hypothetical protein K2H60_08810 [Muribaculaceae bacterium]|nr:hypothetical protein [Muribaculaceae bacterium]